MLLGLQLRLGAMGLWLAMGGASALQVGGACGCMWGLDAHGCPPAAHLYDINCMLTASNPYRDQLEGLAFRVLEYGTQLTRSDQHTLSSTLTGTLPPRCAPAHPDRLPSSTLA